jgi:NitT/TauT family transport system substrate-binding protein
VVDTSGGRFVTTHLVAHTSIIEARRDLVRAIVRAHVETTNWALENPNEAAELVIDGLAAVTGKRIDASIVAAAWANMELTTDPDLRGVSLDGLWDLSLLREIEAEVAGAP